MIIDRTGFPATRTLVSKSLERPYMRNDRTTFKYLSIRVYFLCNILGILNVHSLDSLRLCNYACK